MSAAVGGMGLGLVIGWVAGKFGGTGSRAAISVPAASLALVLTGAAAGLLAGPNGAAGYLVAVLVAITLSIAWRRRLEKMMRQAP
jgi:NhaP-type Na+/H+ or K+/H+ antiporter